MAGRRYSRALRRGAAQLVANGLSRSTDTHGGALHCTARQHEANGRDPPPVCSSELSLSISLAQGGLSALPRAAPSPVAVTGSSPSLSGLASLSRSAQGFVRVSDLHTAGRCCHTGGKARERQCGKRSDLCGPANQGGPSAVPQSSDGEKRSAARASHGTWTRWAGHPTPATFPPRPRPLNGWQNRMDDGHEAWWVDVVVGGSVGALEADPCRLLAAASLRPLFFFRARCEACVRCGSDAIAQPQTTPCQASQALPATTRTQRRKRHPPHARTHAREPVRPLGVPHRTLRRGTCTCTTCVRLQPAHEEEGAVSGGELLAALVAATPCYRTVQGRAQGAGIGLRADSCSRPTRKATASLAPRPRLRSSVIMAGFCQSTAGPADDRRRQPGQAVVRRDALPRHKEAPPALEQTPTIAPAAILAAASKLESFLRPTRVSLLQQRLAAAACARSGTR